MPVRFWMLRPYKGKVSGQIYLTFPMGYIRGEAETAPADDTWTMTSPRKIIHCDCDCFYAAIETRDNPALAGIPLAVGGQPDRRGVVATCNYLAREFGIHSAMSSARARKLCPELVIIRPDMEKYRRASQQIHEIFKFYTEIVEPLSLDEAFLDVTDCLHHDGDASEIATAIRSRVRDKVGITVSAGIAPNKFLAKIASDWRKPDGQFTIAAAEVDDFVKQLPVKRMYGVGKVTAQKLYRMGVISCGDLRSHTEEQLENAFGSFGRRMYELCRGIDERSVETSRVRKSISVEKTYTRDLPDCQTCLDQGPELLAELNRRLGKYRDRYRVSKQIVKMKFNDFVSTTVEMPSSGTDPANYRQLLVAAFARRQRPVRLLGLGARLSPLTMEPTGANRQTVSGVCGDTESDQLPLVLE